MRMISRDGFGGYAAAGGILDHIRIPGLGKTVQVIAFLCHLKEKNKLAPTLIVAPLALLENWKRELLRFIKSLNEQDIYIHHGPGRIRDKGWLEQFDIVLTSYESLVRDQILMGQVDWTCVICDEAQKFRNSSNATAHAVKAMKNKFRLAMTGTPVENGLTELWSIMDYVQPGLLGSLNEFKRRFEQPILSAINREQIFRVEDELLSIIQPVYKRRKKLEVLSDALPKRHEPIRTYVDLGPEQKDLYAKTIMDVKSGDMEALTALNRLRQICSHPGLCDERYEELPLERVPKLAATMNYLKEIANKGEKALIFTFYKKMQWILRRWIMQTFGIHPPIINGDVHDRHWIVEEFNRSPGFHVMILSQQAAGVGLNITGANHVIHYTRWWNPAIENQATDRVYRIGQEKEVYAYYPIVTLDFGKSMEQHLDDLLREKEALAERVLVPSFTLDCQDELLSRLRAEMTSPA